MRRSRNVSGAAEREIPSSRAVRAAKRNSWWTIMTITGHHAAFILLIHEEKAHSRCFSETAYASAAEPKERMIIDGARHVDLCDRLDEIPFDELTTFFRAHLQ